MLTVRWFQQYGRMEVDVHDSLDEAVECAGYAEANRLSLTIAIEAQVQTADGLRLVQIDAAEIRRRYALLPDSAKRRTTPLHPAVAAVYVRQPAAGQSIAPWRCYGTYCTEEAAEAKRAEIAGVLGDERVCVRPRA